MSAAIRNVKRFFRSIALFRRDGVADPQIADRSGDELLDAAMQATAVACNKCDDVWLSIEDGKRG